jgi:hypothetical protein
MSGNGSRLDLQQRLLNLYSDLEQSGLTPEDLERFRKEIEKQNEPSNASFSAPHLPDRALFERRGSGSWRLTTLDITEDMRRDIEDAQARVERATAALVAVRDEAGRNLLRNEAAAYDVFICASAERMGRENAGTLRAITVLSRISELIKRRAEQLENELSIEEGTRRADE